MVKKREIRVKCAIQKCKTIGCAKNNRMCKKKKTVYWDLINSDMNRRDVQTGYSGYVKKKKKKKKRVMSVWMYFL